MTGGEETSEVPAQADGATPADAQPTTDIPDPDEILEGEKRHVEAKRLRDETLDGLETVSGYQKEVMRWVREANSGEANRTFRFMCGNRPMEVIIDNGKPTRPRDIFQVRIYSAHTADTEFDYRGSSESWFQITTPYNPEEAAQINLDGTLNASEKIKPPDHSRRAVAKIDSLIDGITTGFPEPATPPAPEAPTTQ